MKPFEVACHVKTDDMSAALFFLPTNPMMKRDDDDGTDVSGPQLLRSRFTEAMLPASTPDSKQLMMAAAEVAKTVEQSGRWPDINYTTVGDEGRSWWEAGSHLQRTIILATAARKGEAFAAQAEQALRYWIVHDFSNSNWWWQWIGTPRAVAKALLLLSPTAAERLLPLAMPILSRSNYSHPGNPNEATNLVWMAGTRALVGSLTDNTSEITVAYQKIESTVIINAFDEGLQEDGSYHQRECAALYPSHRFVAVDYIMWLCFAQTERSCTLAGATVPSGLGRCYSSGA